MPAWESVIGADGAKDVTAYVLSLSGRQVDAAQAEKGKAIFATNCAACHGVEGKGNPALGAPNLTDDVWLYGGSPLAVETSVLKGRNGQMPAHESFLGKAKVHLLAAYVYSLSHGGGKAGAQ
jgi:cytochrome c oxidase cbb3-type subunit 3